MKAKFFYENPPIPLCPDCDSIIFYMTDGPDGIGYTERCSGCGRDLKQVPSWSRNLLHNLYWFILFGFSNKYILYSCPELVEIKELERIYNLEFGDKVI